MQMTDAQHRRFVFRRLLGEGGFGEVYLADMTIPSGLTTSVAVKVLHDKLDPGSQAVKRLKDEGRILSMLNHPSIVKVFDLAMIEGRVALVTEFVDGIDLVDCLIGSSPMPLGTRYEAMAQVAGALEAAQRATDVQGAPLGLLHRDVKPANVRVGKHGEVKLLDFGIATGAGLDRQAHTGRALVGSFPFMAPERFQQGDVPPSSDFYSLGCTLFEVLTLTRLFDQPELTQLVVEKTQADRHDALVAAQLDAHDISGEAADLLKALTSWDPAGRPSGAEAVARLEDLATATGDPRLSRWARTHSWPNPNPLRGALSGLTIEEAGFQESAPVPPPEPVLPQPRSKAPLILLTVLGALLVLGASIAAGGLIAGVGWMSQDVDVDVAPPTPEVPSPPRPPSEPEPGAAVPEPGAPQPIGGPPEPGAEPQPNLESEPESPEPEPASPEPETVRAEPAPPEPAPSDAVATLEPEPSSNGNLPDCGPQDLLESTASAGTLSNTARACLEGIARQSSARLVDRRKAGRVVLVDATKRCQSGLGCEDYEREQVYFFEELDRSDPEMMYGWARHQAKAGNHGAARLWFGRALERKELWRGRIHVQRVSKCLEGDARSAYALYTAKPSDKTRRTDARNAATTWASYAARVGKDPKPALALCESATGSAAACTSRVHDNAATAEISIASWPAGGLITIDGKGAGTTPLSRELSFGRHTLGITLEGVTSEQVIEVGSAQPVRWVWTQSDGTWSSAF